MQGRSLLPVGLRVRRAGSGWSAIGLKRKKRTSLNSMMLGGAVVKIAFDDDIGTGDTEKRFQGLDDLGALQVAISIENEAVGWCFKHDPAARPLVILG